jgi:carboxymethylenebutenolidase
MDRVAGRLSVPSMKRVAAGALVLGVAAWLDAPWTAAKAGELQTPKVETTTIQYPSAGAMIEAYMARPTGASKTAAVIVVHDDLGLNDTFRDLTQQLAQSGFAALAPNLPSRIGTPGINPPEGRLRPPVPVAKLSASQTLDDLRAAFDFLQKDPAVDGARISIVGAGWGEYRVWRLAEQVVGLHRAVVFYGLTPTDDERVRAVRVPVLGHYAQQDYLIAARAIKTKKLLGDRFTYYIYPTVPGFLGGGSGQLQPATGGYVISLPASPPQNVASSAKQAWARTLEFLQTPAQKTVASNAHPFGCSTATCQSLPVLRISR